MISFANCNRKMLTAFEAGTTSFSTYSTSRHPQQMNGDEKTDNFYYRLFDHMSISAALSKRVSNNQDFLILRAKIGTYLLGLPIKIL